MLLTNTYINKYINKYIHTYIHNVPNEVNLGVGFICRNHHITSLNYHHFLFFSNPRYDPLVTLLTFTLVYFVFIANYNYIAYIHIYIPLPPVMIL